MNPGLYDFEVTARGFQKAELADVRVAGSDPAPIEITLPIGTSVGDCGKPEMQVFQDKDGKHHVIGTVRFTSGKAIRNAVVTLQPSNGSSQLQERTNSSGEFQFDALAPGLYTLKAAAPHSQEKVLKDFRLKPKDSVRVTFVMDEVVLCQ